jgi:hypothetical protein
MSGDITILIYQCSGLPERQDSKILSVAGEGIAIFENVRTFSVQYSYALQMY